MSSRWIFFPTPPAAGVKIQLDAELADYVSKGVTSSTRFNLTNATFSGTDGGGDNYELYTVAPIRKSTSYIEWLFKVIASAEYANAGEWETVVTDAGGIVVAESPFANSGGIEMSTDTITHTHGANSGQILRVRWNANSSTITNFWNTMSSGQTIQIKLNWS